LNLTNGSLRNTGAVASKRSAGPSSTSLIKHTEKAQFPWLERACNVACHCISVLALGRWACLMFEAWGCMCVRVIMASAGCVRLGFGVSRLWCVLHPALTSVSGNLITNGQC